MLIDQPAIMFDFKKSRIRIHKNTLRALNNPAYVLLLINPVDRLIAVQANDGTDARAHRVGIRASKKSYEIYSMALLIDPPIKHWTHPAYCVNLVPK